MSWTVLSVGYPFAQVSDNAVGGAEQVLAMLDRALVEAGHRSLVIAPEGSNVRGTLIPLPSQPEQIDDRVRASAYERLRDLLAETLQEQRVDIIHLHGIDFLSYLPHPGVPALVTLHLPLDWYPEHIFHLDRPRTFLHCVSESQQANAPGGDDFLPPIPNGVDIEVFHPRGNPQNFAMLLGRICPEKGVDIALRACRSTGTPLLIGGQVYPYEAHEKFFRKQVEPLLDQCRRFLGPLALNRKAGLLAKAKCLLIPSMASETSSLVAMEAAASGTPVIAFDAGALPSIVQDGVTGFIVRNEQELQQRIREIKSIDRATCREYAAKRFSHLRTIEAYVRTYERILGL